MLAALVLNCGSFIHHHRSLTRAGASQCHKCKLPKIRWRKRGLHLSGNMQKQKRQQQKNPLPSTDCANRIAGAPFSSCTLKIAGGCDAKNAVGTLTSRQTSRAHRCGAHSRVTSRRTKTNSVATALLLRRATGERDDCIGKSGRRASPLASLE